MCKIECLITWRGRKKVLHVGGERKKSDVLKAIMETDVRDSAQYDRIEVYHSRFEEYVEVAEDYTFCDGDKINLVAKNNGASSMDEESVLPETGTPCETPLLLAPGCSQVNQQQQQQLNRQEYELPAIPLDIKAEIVRMNAGEISSRTKSRIVAWITTHLLTADLYPGRLYETAAKALVLKYPVLRDTIGTGYDSWKVAFKYKMGNIRKSLSSEPPVQEARKKFGKKRYSEDCTVAKKQCRVEKPALDVEEDGGVIDAHIDFMEKEMRKMNPDIIKLEASMKQTLSSRRKWIRQSSPPTSELLLKYPALSLRELLRWEFKAITGVDFEPLILEFINKYGEKCIQLAKAYRPAKVIIAEMQEAIEKAEGTAKTYCFAVGVLKLLPHLVKEQAYFLKGPDAYPSLIISETPYEATEVCAAFEGLKIDVMDIVAGVSTLMEMYWVLNIKYSRKNKNMFLLLEHFCGLRSTALTPLVMRTLSALKSE